MNIERRYFNLEQVEPELETRSLNEDGKRYILGYASIKNSNSRQLTERINGELRTFTEIISTTAFDRADISNVVHLIDHNPEKIVGRTGVNTTVENKPNGLFFKTVIPEEGKATSTQEDLYRNSEQKIVKGASFAFRIAKGGDSWELRNGELFRTINNIAKVVDVTSTYSPAYEDAFTFVRSLDETEIKEVVEEKPVDEPPAPENGLDAEMLNVDFQIQLLKNKKI